MKIFLVGGAVRDELMGITPKDRDYVVTGAQPGDMFADGFKQVGADFPVFLHPETGEEYALARRERKTGSGYHGFTTEFGTDVTLREDLSRRDLTINAMARDVEGQGNSLYDPFGGMEDLRVKQLRHVSAAFAEDPLRVVRLARFYARYNDFTIAPETMELSQEVVDSGELDALPYERFWAEMEKVFTEKEPGRFFEIAYKLGFDVKVKFFREVFGTFRPKYIEMANLIAEAIPQEHRVATYVAIMGTPKALKSVATSVEVMDLHRNVRFARSIQKVLSVESIYALFKQAGGFQRDNTQVCRLSDAIYCMANQGEDIGIEPFMLIFAWDRATHITASKHFPDMAPGKELGDAIMKARKETIAIAMRLDLPK